MFSIDFFTSLFRFVCLRFDGRIEVLYLMSSRSRKMVDEVIHLPPEKSAQGYAEISAYTKRFKLWQRIHKLLPY